MDEKLMELPARVAMTDETVLMSVYDGTREVLVLTLGELRALIRIARAQLELESR